MSTSPPRPASLRAALKRVPLDRMRVLEPACGRGQYLIHFGPGSRGLDRVPQPAFEPAPSQDLAIVQADLDQPGWSAQLENEPPFEAAFLCDVLMHVADPVAFLTDLPRTLTPGAPVFLVEWTLPHRPLQRKIARLVPGSRAVFETDEHLCTFETRHISALFVAAGFTLDTNYLHSFEGTPLASPLRALVRPFWPSRSWLFRSP